VHRKIYDELIERVASRAKSLRLGAGLDPACDMGPLVSAQQRDRVRGYIELGVAEGASMIAGGDWNEAGYFVRPTVFGGMRPASRVMREEIFGPVIVAAEFATDQEALNLANDTRYGLAASIWSNDLDRVRQFTRGLRAGIVWVNAHNPVDAALPFGGFGMSGFGREGGPENLDAYLETKAVWIS
jgi:acyl-CoA reductase-like NAD-dependent aldehyde dehydrogenase